MKLLLYIGNKKFFNKFGGTEKVACTMANEFIRRNWDVVIACSDPEPSGNPPYPLDGRVSLFNLNGTGRFITSLPPWKKILREITRPFRKLGGMRILYALTKKNRLFFAQRLENVIIEVKPDIILSFTIDDLLILSLCRSADSIPVVQMLHFNPEAALRTSAADSSVRDALNRTAVVQTLLESFVPEVKRRCRTKIAVIPNAVTQFSEQKIYKTNGPFRIVNIARFERSQKRQNILISAFSLLAEDFPNWTLHFYGNTENKNYYRHLESLIHRYKLENRVFLHGAAKNVKEELLQADIFAFPSAWEGFGIALLEAMRVGLPVIGFQSAPAVNELIKDNENGILTKDGIFSFASGLRILMENPELRERLGRNGRLFAEKFTPENVWNQWEELLLKVIAEFSTAQDLHIK